MRIIVTGAVGVGKTTVCQRVVSIAKSLGYTCGGILTPKSPDNKGIIIVDIQTGERRTLASISKIYEGPHVGRYFFNPEGIKFGIRTINRGASSDILFVDEMGHLELKGEGFAKALELITIEEVKNSILVIRKELLSAFLARLGFKPLLFETTADNRDELPLKICSSLGISDILKGNEEAN